MIGDALNSSSSSQTKYKLLRDYPLYNAIKYNDPAVVQCLVDHGASVHLEYHADVAALNCYADCLSILLHSRERQRAIVVENLFWLTRGVEQKKRQRSSSS